MIKVKKIVIVEFRGIRNLTLEFNKNNFAICGRNGTGKSGVVDAVEFALTGNISRLSGAGTGSVSLKEHAPHVDSRNNPEKARVIITVLIPSLKNKEVTIERNVGEPDEPIVTPSNPDILHVLSEVAIHPEFTLSRRELIKYVISAPGERAKEVQALLRLDKVESLRVILLKIMNSAKREIPLLKRGKEESQQLLLQTLQITDLSPAKLLKAVNVQRLILGLPEITALTNTTSIKDGLMVSTSSHIPKVQALADIKKIHEVFSGFTASGMTALVSSVNTKLSELAADPAITEGVTRENLLRLAIESVDDACPVCDTPWDPVALKRLITSKLKHFDVITGKRAVAEKKLEPIIASLDSLAQLLKILESYTKLLKPSIDVEPIKNYIQKIKSDSQKLGAFVPVSDTIAIMKNFGVVPAGVIKVITQIESAIGAIPDVTKQEAARDYLTIGQERLKAYRGVSLRHKQADEKAVLATKIFDIYAKVSTEFLETIYKEVQEDFTTLYKFINSDDEKNFKAELTPSIGKLSFDVDFYGRGFFPPGAYHSEGHQDGMGLCLYLALMRHLLGKSFTFAVLDDVLMSVDSGHRREVCKLLKEQFPDTQFILTTHDEVWLKYMKTSGLIGSTSSKFFRDWNVDHGPREWDDRDVWSEIAIELKNSRVPSAAGLMRNYLEFFSAEVCHQLRARVEFHGDGRFDLGDLLPQATSRFSKLLSEGEASATSWKKTADVALIKKRKIDFDALVSNSRIDDWQTNSTIHYNEWMNLQPKDFVPVVDAFHELVKSFSCPDPECNSILYVTPPKGEKETLRCACGATAINLKKK